MDKVYLVSFTSKLGWTNKILPQDNDKTWKRIAKFALAFLTLGTIFVVTLTRDLIKNVYSWLTYKKPAEPKPPTTGEKLKESSLAAVNGLLSGVLTPFMPTVQASQAPNSFPKWGFTSAYVGATTALLGYLAGPRAAYATLAGHAIAFSIKPIANYFWTEKDTAQA